MNKRIFNTLYNKQHKFWYELFNSFIFKKSVKVDNLNNEQSFVYEAHISQHSHQQQHALLLSVSFLSSYFHLLVCMCKNNLICMSNTIHCIFSSYHNGRTIYSCDISLAELIHFETSFKKKKADKCLLSLV